jgi:chemotaxis protein MotB
MADKECKGGAPGWMVTYGDLMSLLLTFFVLLLSFSSIQESKFREAIGSLKGALGILSGQEQVVYQSQIPPITMASMQKNIRIQKMIKSFRDYLKREGLTDNVKLDVSDDGLRIIITDPILFSLGKANLMPDAYSLLKRLADILIAVDGEVKVNGYTCNLPIHTAEFLSNWELSSARHWKLSDH